MLETRVLLGFMMAWVCLSGLLELRVFGQTTGGIQGSITDSWEGNQLAGVNVTVRGTTLATRADLQGRFALTGVPQGNHILIFTKSV